MFKATNELFVNVYTSETKSYKQGSSRETSFENLRDYALKIHN